LPVLGLSELEKRRAKVCRLDPTFALEEFEEAQGFLEDRGLLTLTACCSLPSLFGACHEEPASPGRPGFGQWPKTRWWWGGALERSPGVMTTKLHRGKTLYLAPPLVELVDPLCRMEIVRAEAGQYGDQAAKVMAHLRSAGRSTTDDLKMELGLEARGYQRVRRSLESRGAILSRSISVEAENGGHRHMSEFMRWDQMVNHASGDPEEALAQLVVAVVNAAVLISEGEARRALTWMIPAEVLECSIDEGRISRVSNDLLAAPVN
jgi:predicted transcriptional regulator